MECSVPFVCIVLKHIHHLSMSFMIRDLKKNPSQQKMGIIALLTDLANQYYWPDEFHVLVDCILNNLTSPTSYHHETQYILGIFHSETCTYQRLFNVKTYCELNETPRKRHYSVHLAPNLQASAWNNVFKIAHSNLTLLPWITSKGVLSSLLQMCK